MEAAVKNTFPHVEELGVYSIGGKEIFSIWRIAEIVIRF
jgi:hypothetical protein